MDKFIKIIEKTVKNFIQNGNVPDINKIYHGRKYPRKRYQPESVLDINKINFISVIDDFPYYFALRNENNKILEEIVYFYFFKKRMTVMFSLEEFQPTSLFYFSENKKINLNINPIKVECSLEYHRRKFNQAEFQKMLSFYENYKFFLMSMTKLGKSLKTSAIRQIRIKYYYDLFHETIDKLINIEINQLTYNEAKNLSEELITDIRKFKDGVNIFNLHPFIAKHFRMKRIENTLSFLLPGFSILEFSIENDNFYNLKEFQLIIHWLSELNLIDLWKSQIREQLSKELKKRK